MSTPRKTQAGATLWLAVLGTISCVGAVDDAADSEKPGRPDGDESDGIAVGNDDDGSGTREYAPLQPVPAQMRRLTVAQYDNSVRDIFGDDIKLRTPLEADEATEVFLSIGAAKVGTSERGVEQYRAAALDIAEQVFARQTPDILAGCKASSDADPCIDERLRAWGLRLFRRPLTEEERTRYHAVVTADGVTSDRVRTGLQFALAALLQSPNFLYVTAFGEDDEATGGRRYTSHEQASRLAYFILDSAPDEELLQAASAGRLTDAADLASAARRLLKTPRGRDLAARFFAEQWLVGKLDITDKNDEVFPDWNQSLLDAYRDEFAAVLRDVTSDDPRDLGEIFVSKRSYTSAHLAAFYGLPRTGDEPLAVTTLDDRRWGLLTTGAVVAANSPSDRSSPTHRGVFVIERLLCEEVPPPPANVNNTLEEAGAQRELSVRERLEMHRSDPACAACHAIFDPAGLTFESFDGIGAHRERDGAHAVDTRGALDGKALDDVGALARLLREDPRTTACMARRFYQYALAHAVEDGEQGVVDLVVDRFADANHKFPALVEAIASSAGFRHLARPE